MEKTGHFFPTSSIGSEKRAKTGVTGITAEAEQIAEQKIGVCRSPFFCRIPNSFQEKCRVFCRVVSIYQACFSVLSKTGINIIKGKVFLPATASCYIRPMHRSLFQFMHFITYYNCENSLSND